MKCVFVLITLIIAPGLFVPWASGYEEITVKNGGTLTGKITLDGEVPNPKGYNLVSFPDPIYCGRISNGNGWRLLQPFQVGSRGEFQNIVIYFEKIKRGKKFDYEPPLVEATDCRFAPYITVVRDGHKVDVVNKDPVLHDIQAYETSKLGARVLFNVPLPMSKNLQKKDFLNGKKVKKRAGQVLAQKVKTKKGRNIFAMQCGFHPYMESWGLAVNNPYFALSDQEGRYSITDLPPGTYKVIAWHPMLNKEFEVTIEPDKTTNLNVKFNAPKGRLYANEAQEQTRFGMELLGGKEIKPTVELQK